MCKLLIIIWTVLLVANSIHGSVIKLFNRFHFYELVIQGANQKPVVNSFKYTVNGEGKCFASVETLDAEAKAAFAVKAAASIYSNFEFTLSFLNEVELEVLDDLAGRLRGVQLEFEAPDGEVSCVQIIPDKGMGVDFKEVRFLCVKNVGVWGVHAKVAHFECEQNLKALRKKNIRHIIRKILSNNMSKIK
jgi:hypothetical protein